MFDFLKKSPAERGKESAMTIAMSAKDFSKTPFRKQLRWWVKNPPTNTIKMTVTPEIASEMLEWNTRNRAVTKNTVDEYARHMKQGTFSYTRVPIIFSSERLIDGQHRLLACLQSGASFLVDIAFGAPDEAFKDIDRGKKRTAGDIFSIYGIPNYSLASASIRWVMRHKLNGMFDFPSGKRPTPEELYRFYLEHADIQDYMQTGRRMSKAKLASPTLMIALHYILAKKNKQQADEFFERVLSGVGFTSETDPAYKLREKLLDDRSGHDRLNDLAVGAYVVQAWNAMRTGRRIGLFRWRGGQNPNEPFPKEV